MEIRRQSSVKDEFVSRLDFVATRRMEMMRRSRMVVVVLGVILGMVSSCPRCLGSGQDGDDRCGAAAAGGDCGVGAWSCGGIFVGSSEADGY